MIEGYTVKEAANVLGVPSERVWELIARGILAAEPEGTTGMRVFLQPRAPVNVDRPGRVSNGDPDRGSELSPFRELLTEFRNLTERYGQALLALGEARGEVASLRSRVDLLEARIDLRLPSSAAPAPPPLPWSAPAPVSPDRPPATGAAGPMPDVPAPPSEEPQPDAPTASAPEPAETEVSATELAADSAEAAGEESLAPEPAEAPPEPVAAEAQVAPEPAVASEPDEATASEPAAVEEAAPVSSDEATTTGRRPRRARWNREAMAWFAEALARAEDPTRPELPEAREAGTPIARRESGVIGGEPADDDREAWIGAASSATAVPTGEEEEALTVTRAEVPGTAGEPETEPMTTEAVEAVTQPEYSYDAEPATETEERALVSAAPEPVTVTEAAAPETVATEAATREAATPQAATLEADRSEAVEPEPRATAEPAPPEVAATAEAPPPAPELTAEAADGADREPHPQPVAEAPSDDEEAPQRLAPQVTDEALPPFAESEDWMDLDTPIEREPLRAPSAAGAPALAAAGTERQTDESDRAPEAVVETRTSAQEAELAAYTTSFDEPDWISDDDLGMEGDEAQATLVDQPGQGGSSAADEPPTIDAPEDDVTAEAPPEIQEAPEAQDSDTGREPAAEPPEPLEPPDEYAAELELPTSGWHDTDAGAAADAAAPPPSHPWEPFGAPPPRSGASHETGSPRPLPGGDELDDALAALGTSSAARTEDAGRAPSRQLGGPVAPAFDWRSSAVPSTAQGSTDADWLSDRTGPAARAYRRLRRIFPG